MKAKIRIDLESVISEIDPRIYGSFVEHLGRCVYGGIYDPGQATADELGFRQDVIELVKDLNVPIVRYPGGNFVSGYNWEDGTGPKELRPKKIEQAWFSIETNQVGVDDFQEWAKRANTEVMMTVNLGTRGPEEARNLVEYCNMDTPTYFADKRRAHGFEKPFKFKTWCLGNEMDGPWQICHKTADEYGRVANEAAKLMKWADEDIELVACGSSNSQMPTFKTWERTVLRHCYENVDYLSLHSYYGNRADDTAEFLSQSMDMDQFIDEIIAICDEIQAEKKSDKKMMLSFDEWNVWFHSNEADQKMPKWQVAPPLLQDLYNFEDALVVGCLMTTLLKHADRVKIACLAQLVNVIAPIMTETGGRVWKQTTYYPFLYTSKYGRGYALNTVCECDTYDVSTRNNVPYIETIAVKSKDGSQVALFAINRSLDEDCTLELEGFEGMTAVKHVALECDDLQAVNTVDEEKVSPIEKPIGDTITIKKHSWNMMLYKLFT